MPQEQCVAKSDGDIVVVDLGDVNCIHDSSLLMKISHAPLSAGRPRGWYPWHDDGHRLYWWSRPSSRLRRAGVDRLVHGYVSAAWLKGLLSGKW